MTAGVAFSEIVPKGSVDLVHHDHRLENETARIFRVESSVFAFGFVHLALHEIIDSRPVVEQGQQEALNRAATPRLAPQ